MRRLTAKQIAAMMTASTGLAVSIGTGLRIPVMALAPVFVSQDAVADDEIPILEEIVVISTAILDNAFMDETYFSQPPVYLGAEYTNTVGSVPFTAGQVAAVRCALKYSMIALGDYGQAPGYTTQFNNSEWGWGINPPFIPPTISTPTKVQPLTGYFLINGHTSENQEVSTIWLLNNQMDATYFKISLQTQLVNTIVHEWYHSWHPFDPNGEDNAGIAGDEAQSAYLAGGGDSQNCGKGGS
jgi:hypothetical protein